MAAAPDDLSAWEAAPPAARARGAPELIRTFDTAEAALAFLAEHVAERSPKAAPLMRSSLSRRRVVG
jgi:hypothetical protein